MTHGDTAGVAAERFAATRHFGSLDGLRALAVVAVVWHHTRDPALRAPLVGKGFLGVDLFFVISGFLITTLLLRERSQHGHVALGRFLVRRALRLVPLWFTVLAVSGALIAAFTPPDSYLARGFREDLVWYVTYTSNWIRGHTFLTLSWSLAVEEQFYLVWPLLLLRGRPLHLVLLVGAGLASAASHLGLLDALWTRLFAENWGTGRC